MLTIPLVGDKGFTERWWLVFLVMSSNLILTMSNMIKTLHIVAPQLNITQSNFSWALFIFHGNIFYVKEQNVLGEFGWIWRLTLHRIKKSCSSKYKRFRSCRVCKFITNMHFDSLFSVLDLMQLRAYKFKN